MIKKLKKKNNKNFSLPFSNIEQLRCQKRKHIYRSKKKEVDTASENIKNKSTFFDGKRFNVLEILMDNIFGERSNKNKRKRILKLWLSRRMIINDYKIYTSKLFGSESIILTKPHLEYRAIFEAIASLKYCFVVSVNTITLFSNPVFKSRELHEVYCGSECNGNGTFSIPTDHLDKYDIEIVNELLKQNKLKNAKFGKLPSPFCVFNELSDRVCGKKFKKGIGVGLKYKRVILSEITEEIIGQAMSDSIRVSHIMYNNKYGSYDVNVFSSNERVFILKNI